MPGAAMIPLRSGHLSVATSALVLVVPVVVGAAVGGFSAGIVGTAIGFFVYDFVFVPPYHTLSVVDARNWAALTAADATAQIPMVSRATGIAPSRLRALIARETHGAQFGFLGSSDIDVLQLNEALARLH